MVNCLLTSSLQTVANMYLFIQTKRLFSIIKLYFSFHLLIHFHYINLPLILLTNFLCTGINKRRTHKTKDGFAMFCRKVKYAKDNICRELIANNKIQDIINGDDRLYINKHSIRITYTMVPIRLFT